MNADELLIHRIRPILSGQEGGSEQKMFGGVCFSVNGNICVGVWKGSIIVRLANDRHDETMAEPHTKPFEIAGRLMKGWAQVEPAGIESDQDLEAWVSRAVQFAATLPSA